MTVITEYAILLIAFLYAFNHSHFSETTKRVVNSIVVYLFAVYVAVSAVAFIYALKLLRESGQ